MFNYLKLTRPANILTAMADIFLGFSASGFILRETGFYGGQFSLTHTTSLLFLLLASSCLYAGGIVFNDIFDLNLDKKERPERPLPSGKISKQGATIFATILLIIGITSASFVGVYSFVVAINIAAFALLYDSWGKHQSLGPLNMGICRGLNLLLGLSASPENLHNVWMLTFIPTIYIATVTMISREEVHGGTTRTLQSAFILYAIVILGCLSLSLFPSFTIVTCIPFLLLFSFLIYNPLLQAQKNPSPTQIKKVVRAGIISLIILDSALSAGFAGWGYGLLVLALLPISARLAKLFAVT